MTWPLDPRWEAPERGRRGPPKRPARARLISRDFHNAVELRDLGFWVRTAFLGCLLCADDEGRFLLDYGDIARHAVGPDFARCMSRPRTLRAVSVLSARRLLAIYPVRVAAKDEQVAQVVNWHKWQHLNNPCPSRWPPLHPDAMEQYLREGFFKVSP